MSAIQTAFIVGSPRSGTTVLANALGCHDAIAEWYEPYYIWEEYFPRRDSDVVQPADITPEAAAGLRREFDVYRAKAGRQIVLDKSPGHSLRLGAIRTIFPEARWIHLIRDGRDATLSIRKEWTRRQEMVVKKDFLALFKTAFAMLRRQPFWRYRWRALRHELRRSASLNPARYLNRSRWRGKPGWGPRFEGWEDCLATHGQLHFNAMQWVKCVEAVRAEWPAIPDAQKLEVRYEDLLRQPQEVLAGILEFLQLEDTPEFRQRVPEFNAGNVSKWAAGFSEAELGQIVPILRPTLEALGYETEEIATPP